MEEISKVNFIRIGERAWITRSVLDHQYYKLQDIRTRLYTLYTNYVNIKILEDLQYYNNSDLKSTLENALRSGIQNMTISSKYVFLQIVFIDDASNVDFMMKSSNDEEHFMKLMKELNFY